MRRAYIRRESKKTAAARRIYNKRRALFLEANPWCAVGGCVATEVHHMAGRGAALLDESRWLPLCRDHHAYVTEHPREAIERGWSLPRIGRAS